VIGWGDTRYFLAVAPCAQQSATELLALMTADGRDYLVIAV